MLFNVLIFYKIENILKPNVYEESDKKKVFENIIQFDMLSIRDIMFSFWIVSFSRL